MSEDETTTEVLAEIEGQAEPQPVQVREGRWRTRNGEIRNVTPTPADHAMATLFPWHDAAGLPHRQLWRDDGKYINGSLEHGDDLLHYLGPIEPEPEPTITPDDVAAEAINEWPSVKILRQQLETTEAALLEQQQRNEQLVTQGSQQRMEIAELQAQVQFLKNRELTLGTRLEEEKAVTTKRLDQIQELRSEVSHVQGLLGEEKLQNVRLETLVADLRAVNAAQEKGANSEARNKADLQHRLDVVSSEWALQAETIRGLESLLEAVKAELVQQAETARRLQIELDAREQVPQAVSDRFEEGWDKGTAQAVETIAEWTEPFRQMIEKADNLVESDRASRLCAEIMQSLPAIMRSLTGFTEED